MESGLKGSSNKFKDIINRNVITISPFESVSEAAYLMRNEDIGALVVVDKESKPIGVITDRDLVVSVVAERINPAEVTVEDIMTKNPITVDEDTDLFDILKTLPEYSVRRLPVTNNGKLAGIVSVDDLIVIVATELVNLAMAMSSKSKVI
jgi:CBS domain-containing protein